MNWPGAGTNHPSLYFCSQCGQRLNMRVPPGDDRPRHVCSHCQHVHYQNPLLVVCAIPCFEDKVLLCKRAIEPRYGLWTLPGGFMELNESTLDCAVRETREEACAQVRIEGLYSLYNLPHIHQVHLFYRARLNEAIFAPGIESLEVALMTEDEIPWGELAFTAVSDTLRHYFRERRLGQFSLHTADVVIGPDGHHSIRTQPDHG